MADNSNGFGFNSLFENPKHELIMLYIVMCVCVCVQICSSVDEP